LTSFVSIFVLLSEALAFYRQVLFLPRQYVIPYDFRGYHLPLAQFMALSLRRGELPLWDPYPYCGMPIYANLAAQVFYPPTIATVLLSNWIGGGRLGYLLEWQLVLHVFLGGAFTFWLLRRLRTGNTAALIGATVYELGGFFASQTQHLGAMDAGAWLPLAWLCVIELQERFSWHWTAALAIALAMTVLAGFPAVAAVIYGSCFLLALPSIRGLARVALAAAWSLLLAAVQLLPTFELTRLSVAKYRSDWMGNGGGLPVQSLVSLLMPNYYGILHFDPSTWRLPWNPTFLYLYCGIPALVFVLTALGRRPDRRAARFGVLTLIFVFWMLGESTIIGRTVFRLLPDAIKSFLYQEYVISAFTLGMAVLAALGAHTLIDSQSLLLRVSAVVLVAADLIGVGSARPMNTGSLKKEPDPPPPRAVQALVNEVNPPWRIDTVNGSMDWALGASLRGVPNANGNDPFALIRLMQVRLSFCKGKRWGRYYEPADLNSPVLDLMNVRFIVSRQLPGSIELKKAAEIPGEQVFERPNALPRFFMVQRVHSVSSPEEALQALRTAGMDFRSEAVIEGDAASESGGSIHLMSYGPRRIELHTEASKASFLVTSEAYYPGWRAWVDDTETKLVLTNVAFRGLAVPAGAHRVTMRFQPAILPGSAAISAVASLAILLSFWQMLRSFTINNIRFLTRRVGNRAPRA
jgi:hypothetical protein